MDKLLLTQWCNIILYYLRNMAKFAKKYPLKKNSRSNIIEDKTNKNLYTITLNLGKVRSYSKKELVFSKQHTKNKALWQILNCFMSEIDEKFKFNSVFISKNLKCGWHTDKNNIGLSYGLSLGDHQGGGCIIKDENGDENILDYHNYPRQFDGHKLHKTLDYNGERFVLIFYTHK